MPRKKKAAAPAAEKAPPVVKPETPATPEAPKAEKPKAEKAPDVVVSSRYHEPYRADAWFVTYALSHRVEPFEDGAFRTEEAALEHAARIREAYGLK